MKNPFDKSFFRKTIARSLPLAALLFLMLFSAQTGAAQMQPSRRAEKLSKDAYSEFYKGNFKKAIENSDKAIRTQPNSPYAYYVKGWSLFRMGQFQPALDSLNKAAELGHDATEVAEPRGYTYMALKDYPNAERNLLEFVNSPKNNGAASYALAQVYLEQKKYGEASNQFQRSSDLGFKDKDTNYYIAVSQGALDNSAAQEKAAMLAVQENSQFKAEAYYQAGLARQRQKKYEEAITAYEGAIGLKSGMTEAYFKLYEVYRLLNRESAAVDIMKRLTRVDSQNFQAYLNLSWIGSLSDRPQEAVEAARMATKLRPAESVAFTNMCRAYNDLKLYDSAVQACTDSLKIKPGDGETYLYLARAKYELKKDSEATLLFERAVTGLQDYTKQNPDNADGFYLLGNAFYSAKQRSKAIPAYLKALDINPRYVKARYNLGYIYAQLGDHKSAKEQYDFLVVLDADLAKKLLPNIEKPGK
jgi:tetratricopeptide (TPR) repeat protein